MDKPFGPYSTHILNVSPEPAALERKRWSIPMSFEVVILLFTIAALGGMGAGMLIGRIIDAVRKTGGW